VLHIGWPYPFASDKRNNEQVKQALIQVGLYHAGIDIEIDTTNALTIIDNGDTATIEYTFTLVNNDKDDLYVFDPDIAGSDVYHYFSNGPVFYSVSEDKLYISRFKKARNPDTDWSPEWYTKLQNGQSLQRTATLKGYPHFPTGTYFFRVRYGGPDRIDRGVRNTPNGRYWIPGNKYSNVLIWENQEPINQNITHLVPTNLSDNTELRIIDHTISTNDSDIIK
jgi:hypothetical protein